MRIRKGLPPGYMKVNEELRPLIEQLHQLSPQDITEVEAFIKYLRSGAEQLDEFENGEGRNLKLYDFMEGGLGEKSTTDETPAQENVENQL